MKVAVSSKGASLTSEVDARFGRAKYFILADTETGDFEPIENSQNLNAAQGAGIQSAQTVVESGAEALISGHCGPKAFRVLKAGEVKIFTNASGTVADALEQLKAGSLEETAEADVDSHWI